MEPIATTTADVEPSAPARLRAIRLSLAVAWTLTVCVLCWMPRSVMQHVEGDSSWLQVPNLDKAAHFTIFLLFAILWARSVTWPRRALGIGIAGLMLAIVTELGQTLSIVGRDATIGDGVADLIATAIGLAIAGPIEPMFRWAERLVFGAKLTGG